MRFSLKGLLVFIAVVALLLWTMLLGRRSPEYRTARTILNAGRALDFLRESTGEFPADTEAREFLLDFWGGKEWARDAWWGQIAYTQLGPDACVVYSCGRDSQRGTEDDIWLFLDASHQSLHTDVRISPVPSTLAEANAAMALENLPK